MENNNFIYLKLAIINLILREALQYIVSNNT